MTCRALLIGSETYGLSGCNADVQLMETVLIGRGFTEIEVLTDSAATRSGILAGFEQLIRASANDDAAVVYYSGHGGRVKRPDWEARQAAGHDPFVQFVVPSDMGSTTATDFRGLLSVELSELQRRLTKKTRNVTTILDCCHSGLMSRHAVLIPKARGRASGWARLAGFGGGLVGRAVSLARLDGLSSRSVVWRHGRSTRRIGLTARLRLAISRPCRPTPPHPPPFPGASFVSLWTPSDSLTCSRLTR